MARNRIKLVKGDAFSIAFHNVRLPIVVEGEGVEKTEITEEDRLEFSITRTDRVPVIQKYYPGEIERNGDTFYQDIFEYAVDFLTQVGPEDIREEALADVISIQSLYVWHYLKYALIFSVLWSAFGLLLVFLGNMHWILCAVFFFAISLLILIGFLCAFIREKERRYIVTQTTIYYFHGRSNAAGRIKLLFAAYNGAWRITAMRAHTAAGGIIAPLKSENLP